jgi:ABC-type nitrate/sulfonate/bicarbonate transport system substrate-binding protein
MRNPGHLIGRLLRSRRGRQRTAVLAAGLSLVTLVAACGSSGPSESTSSGKATTYNLTIGVGSPNLSYGAFWVALAQNLFAKNGVNVKVFSYTTDGQTADIMAAGKVQLEVYGPSAATQLDQRGQPALVLNELSAFSAGVEAVIGNPKVKTVSQLKQVKNCRIATDDVGTLPYAYAQRWKNAEGLSNCSLMLVSGPPALAAAVSTDAAQAGVEVYSVALAALDAGKASLLLNPLSIPPALAKELAPQEYPVGSIIALPSQVKANPQATVRFLRAIRQANAIMVKSSPATLGTETAKLKAFAGASPKSLTNAWKGVLGSMPTGADAGYISQSDWQAALQGLVSWDLPGYDKSSPSLTYSKAVDMSYFNQAK